MIADKIKQLRTSRNMTQSDLAKKLNITRSSVNAWEMGLSTPSTAYLAELSQLFHVSTDYLLGLLTMLPWTSRTSRKKRFRLSTDLVQYFRDKK